MRPQGLLLLLVGSASAFLAPTSIPGQASQRSRAPSCTRLPATEKKTLARPPIPLASLRAGTGPATPAENKLHHKLAEIMADCSGFGLTRFVMVGGAGAILETTSDFDLVAKGFEVPGKGKYLTLATEDKLFELHIGLDKVTEVTFSQDPAKAGGHTMHVMRLKGENGTPMLSCMLQYDPAKGPGNYFEGSVAAFEKLMGKYGPSVKFCQ